MKEKSIWTMEELMNDLEAECRRSSNGSVARRLALVHL
jgi:hypothetical protein